MGSTSVVIHSKKRLTRIPWLFFVVFFSLILGASEGGFWLGQRSNLQGYQETKAQLIAVEEGVLGILALLLAFSLVMAVSRFDSRRLLVVEEANAISTTYWRCRLVPPPEGTELIGLLHEYVDAKIHYFDSGTDRDCLLASRERTTQLQKELWSRAAAGALKDPRSVPAGLLLESLSRTFDLENSRWTALTVHVPGGVLWVDSLVALLASLLVGYNFGLTGHRHPISMCVLAVCVASVLAVILDLDQPRRGLIQVGQQPLIDLQRQLAEMR
jgi:hypothetical protein